MNKQAPRRASGFSLIETAISVACLGILMGSASVALIQIDNAFAETESSARVVLQAERALSRLNELVSQAVTTDDDFGYLGTSDGSASGVSFRLLDSVEDADLTYDGLNVYVVGPTEGATPCEGLVIARGSSLASAFASGAGKDGVLGTTDDDTGAIVSAGTPSVEMLIPSTFIPQEGQLFTIQQPADGSRLLQVTIRMNLREPSGEFILGEDVVIVEEIAMRQ